jgi:acyl-CoA ligase (AMP-forming) (exosortase A-associated)
LILDSDGPMLHCGGGQRFAGLVPESGGCPWGEWLDRRIEGALFRRAREAGSAVALVDGGRPVSYAELAERSAALAARLVAAGLAPGDRVAVHLDKETCQVAALYGAWAAGAIVVPVNEGLRTRQVEHIVRHSGSRLFVSSARKLAALDRGAVGAAQVVCVEEPAPAASGPVPAARPGGAEPAAILYTSGSTGAPKGILLSHDNLLAGARIVASYLEIRHDERILSVLPFSFDYGLNQLLTSVACGATLVLQRSMLPADLCRTMIRERITGMAAVPPLWLQLLQGHSPFRGLSFPDLRYITNSGGIFPVEAVRQYRSILPHTRIYLMYGLSEAFRSTYLPHEEIDRRPTSMGRAIPECELLVLGADGRPCAPGEVGELVHRGPTVALGYWMDPEATARVFRPDPFPAAGGSPPVVHSGDFVKTDAEGYLYFVGRRDEMIKSHGFRISPGEVEEAVFESGLVREVVVKGEPDPIAGAAVVVHCVPLDVASFSREALLDWCRKTMPRYMVPVAIHVHDAFPRTPSGKIDRKAVTP